MLVMAPGGSWVTKAFRPQKVMGPQGLSPLLRMSLLSTAQPRTSQETGRAAGASWSAGKWRSGELEGRGQRSGQPMAARPAPGRPPGPRQPADVPKTGPESSLSSRPTKARPLRDRAGGGRSSPPAAVPHLQGPGTPSCETGEPPHRGLPGKRRRPLRGPPASSSRLAPDPDVPRLRPHQRAGKQALQSHREVSAVGAAAGLRLPPSPTQSSVPAVERSRALEVDSGTGPGPAWTPASLGGPKGC